jgi:hypothetical protein
MGAEQQPASLLSRQGRRVDIQRVVHVHRRMVRRKVERGEVIPVGLHLRTYRDGESDSPEDADDLVDDPGDRMLGTDPPVASRHGAIDGGLLLASTLRFQHLAAPGERLLEKSLEPIDRRAVGLPLLCRPGGHRPERSRELTAFPPQDGDDLAG